MKGVFVSFCQSSLGILPLAYRLFIIQRTLGPRNINTE